jgi:hypothetical protein
MIKINKIIWDFSDTEFEDCSYEAARRITILPESLKIKSEDLESDADEEEIIEYLSENFGFCVESIEMEDD